MECYENFDSQACATVCWARRDVCRKARPSSDRKDCPFVGARGCTAAESLSSSKASRLRIHLNGDPHVSLRVRPYDLFDLYSIQQSGLRCLFLVFCILVARLHRGGRNPAQATRRNVRCRCRSSISGSLISSHLKQSSLTQDTLQSLCT